MGAKLVIRVKVSQIDKRIFERCGLHSTQRELFTMEQDLAIIAEPSLIHWPPVFPNTIIFY
jgi:hypothetical protein